MTVVDRIAGFVGGGPSRVEAGGATAYLFGKVEEGRNKLLGEVRAFGAKLGPKWGSGLFKELYEGAQEPAAAAVAEKERELFGIDRQGALLLALGGFVVLLLLLRRR